MNIRKILAISLAAGLSLSPLAKSHASLIENDILNTYGEENIQSEEDIKREYEVRLELTAYLAELEQNQVEEKILDEYKEAYNDETSRLFNYLNTKNLSEEDIKEIETKTILKSILAVSIEEDPSPLTSENLEIIETKVSDFMNGGILIDKPILSENFEDKFYQRSDLLNLVNAIARSKNFIKADLDRQKEYGQILKEASEVLEDELADEDTIDKTYKDTLNAAKEINDNFEEKEEDDTSDQSLDNDVNTGSEFFNNLKYKDFYLDLNKEQQDELDKMREHHSTKSYLTIAQFLSIGKYGLPVYDTDWPYSFMYDKNDNGIVGENYQEDAIADDPKLGEAYKSSDLSQRYIIFNLDTDKDGYISQYELDQADISLDNDENKWLAGFMKENESKEEAISETPQTTTLSNNEVPEIKEEDKQVNNPQVQTIETTPAKSSETTTQVSRVPNETSIPSQSNVNTSKNISSSSNVDTGIGTSIPLIGVLVSASVAYFKSKETK